MDRCIASIRDFPGIIRYLPMGPSSMAPGVPPATSCHLEMNGLPRRIHPRPPNTITSLADLRRRFPCHRHYSCSVREPRCFWQPCDAKRPSLGLRKISLVAIVLFALANISACRAECSGTIHRLSYSGLHKDLVFLLPVGVAVVAVPQ